MIILLQMFIVVDLSTSYRRIARGQLTAVYYMYLYLIYHDVINYYYYYI